MYRPLTSTGSIERPLCFLKIRPPAVFDLVEHMRVDVQRHRRLSMPELPADDVHRHPVGQPLRCPVVASGMEPMVGNLGPLEQTS